MGGKGYRKIMVEQIVCGVHSIQGLAYPKTTLGYFILNQAANIPSVLYSVIKSLSHNNRIYG